MRILKFSDPDFATVFAAIEGRGATPPEGVEATVREILAAVRKRGDAALFEYTEKFDRLELSAATVEVTTAEIDSALAAVSEADLAALRLASERIATFHAKQKQETWISTDEEDVLVGQKVRPLDRVGLYVPGGKAAYPSSVMMNAVPAKVAGVAEIIMVVPMPGGEVNPHVLAAAHLAGVDRIFKVGGAQAVAALAYGTANIPGSTRSPAPATSMSPPPSNWSSARSTST